MSERLDRPWFEAHLPHAGAMNLLDEVVRWDRETLVAHASSHRDAGHPLRRAGELPIVAAIEYGAQAAAAHGALSTRFEVSRGMLASVRDAVFHAARLDDAPAPLEIRVAQLGGDASAALYRFEVRAADRTLAEGRVAVAFVR